MLGFQLVLPLEGAALLKEVWLWSGLWGFIASLHLLFVLSASCVWLKSDLSASCSHLIPGILCFYRLSTPNH